MGETRIQVDRAKIAAALCQHPWGAVRRSIGCVICTECGERFRGDAGAAIVLKIAEEAITSAYERIENLEDAVSAALKMTSCQVCGKWFVRVGNTGICLKIDGGDTHVCGKCLPEWFEGYDFESDDNLATAEVQLARWFIRYGEKAGGDLLVREGVKMDRLRGRVQHVIELQALRLP